MRPKLLLLLGTTLFASFVLSDVSVGTNEIRICGTNDPDSAMSVTFVYNVGTSNVVPMVIYGNISIASGNKNYTMYYPFQQLPQSSSVLGTGNTVWRATLHNLTPQMRYYYRVGLTGSWSAEYDLVAPVKPTKPSEAINIKMALVADLDVGATFQLYMPIITTLFDNGNALGLSPGNIAAGPDDIQWDNWGKVVEPFSARFPFLISPGPTDVDNLGNAFNYATRFTFPNANSSFWYSYDFSLAHIISISTMHNYTVGSDQYQWLENDLQQANTRRDITPWIILQGYASMYSGQGADYFLRQNIEPLLYKYGVDLAVWNGHQFIQSKPIYDEVAHMYNGNGSLGQPYLNAATIHLQVGTGGVNLITTCVPQDWTDANLCTYGVTNITILTNGTMFGMFRQIQPEHNWQVDKKNISCPNNCNGKGTCSKTFFRCVCQPPWYGTDCSNYQKRDVQVPTYSTWKFTTTAPSSNWTLLDYDDTEWSLKAAPIRASPAPYNFRDKQRPGASSTDPYTRSYIRQTFHSVLPTNGSWIVAGRALFTEQPSMVSLNNMSIPISYLSFDYYYSYAAFFNSSYLNPNGSNILAVQYTNGIYYFDGSIDIKYACQKYWYTDQCNVYIPYTGPPAQTQVTEAVVNQIVNQQSSGNAAAVGAGVGVSLFVLLVALAAALVAVWWYRKTKNARLNNNWDPEVNIPGELGKDWEIDYNEIQIGDELGRGAFGVVFKARWRNADCVVKQMHEEFASDKSALNNFLKEANNMKNLRPHPNVCDLLGVCTKPGSPICIVTELLSEGSLVDLFANGKISIDAALAVSIAKDIASGMSHLHKENILHCDLAARNLLVSLKGKDQYVIKVADFGLSHISESDNYNLKAEAKFPIRWSAPEVMTRGQVSKMSDIWSFGVVIWEILEWKKPYHQVQLNADVMKQVCDSEKNLRLERPTRIEIPDELWAIMQSCWLTNPNKRPSFQDLYRQLGDLEIAMGKEEQSSFLSSHITGGAQLNYLRSPPTDDTKGKKENAYEQTGSVESAYTQTPAKKPEESDYHQTPGAAPQRPTFTQGSFIHKPVNNRPTGGVFTSPHAQNDPNDHYTQTPHASSDRSHYEETSYFQTPSRKE